jgi:hypothetical protein
VYGLIAAFRVELFPARIRYTSMSLPYHIGNGWFGGMLPLLAPNGRGLGGHLLRAVVSNQRVDYDFGGRYAILARDEGPEGATRFVNSLALSTFAATRRKRVLF